MLLLCHELRSLMCERLTALCRCLVAAVLWGGRLQYVRICGLANEVRVVDVRNQLFDSPEALATAGPLAQLRPCVLLAFVLLDSIRAVLLLLLLLP